jgi:hypothetical protein
LKPASFAALLGATISLVDSASAPPRGDARMLPRVTRWSLAFSSPPAMFSEIA